MQHILDSLGGQEWLSMVVMSKELIAEQVFLKIFHYTISFIIGRVVLINYSTN